MPTGPLDMSELGHISWARHSLLPSAVHAWRAESYVRSPPSSLWVIAALSHAHGWAGEGPPATELFFSNVPEDVRLVVAQRTIHSVSKITIPEEPLFTT